MDAIELLEFRWKKYLHRISWESKGTPQCHPHQQIRPCWGITNHFRFPWQYDWMHGKKHDELLSAKLQQHLKRFKNIGFVWLLISSNRTFVAGVFWQWSLMSLEKNGSWIVLERHLLKIQQPLTFQSSTIWIFAATSLNISFDLHTSTEHDKWLSPNIM